MIGLKAIITRINGNIKEITEFDLWSLDYNDLHKKSVNQLDDIEKDYLAEGNISHIFPEVKHQKSL